MKQKIKTPVTTHNDSALLKLFNDIETILKHRKNHMKTVYGNMTVERWTVKDISFHYLNGTEPTIRSSDVWCSLESKKQIKFYQGDSKGLYQILAILQTKDKKGK